MSELARIGVSLIPVFALMGALILLDSYKLVAPRSVMFAVAAGIGSALLSLSILSIIARSTNIDLSVYIRYLAPVVEETLKCGYLIFLLRSNRIGFMVDAAIYGFAVGAGFATVENLFYLVQLENVDAIVWMVRGFGTAAVHASTIAMFSVIAKTLADRRDRVSAWVFVPGWFVAVVTHSLYNHFIIAPTTATILLLAALPLIVFLIFDRSERSTKHWLGTGFDADQEMMRMLSTGEYSESHIGQYLESLRSRFPGTVVADMFCLLGLHAELALRAKGILMMREAGITVQPDPEIDAKLDELKYLESNIGKTGLMAIHPLLHTSKRDLWQIRSIR